MRVMLWYCSEFSWQPSMKTVESAEEAKPGTYANQVVAFVHVEPKDIESGSQSETKLVKNCKWLARKWGVKSIILHSFAHLGTEKADVEESKKLFDRVETRLKNADYEVIQTPYGYFLDINIKAPGKPLARIYKEF